MSSIAAANADRERDHAAAAALRPQATLRYDGLVHSAPCRRVLAWVCIAACLSVGIGAQRHALWHALQRLHVVANDDAALLHGAACELCLQFAASSSAAPTTTMALPPRPAADSVVVDPRPVGRRAEAFAAYASRAPPAG